MKQHRRPIRLVAVISVFCMLGFLAAPLSELAVNRFTYTAAAIGGYTAVDMLGQIDGADTPFYTSSGAQNTINARGMSIPRGSALDETNHRLFIADQSANRVLVFNLDVNNAPVDLIADYVLGQPDFKTASADLTQSTLNGPSAVAYDATGNRLFVADQSNARVMVFDVAAITNGENAINVLGQTDFVTPGGGTSQSLLAAPTGLAFDDAGDRLFVTDQSNDRVMVFNVAAITDGENAVNELGQADFSGSTGSTAINRLYQPTGVVYGSSDRLFVSDTTSNRVMVFNVAAITDGEDAVNVIGQPDFTTGTVGLTDSKMYIPSGVAFDAAGNKLFVTDTGNQRVTVFDVSTIINGEPAISVLGQTDYITRTTGTTIAKLNNPSNPTYNPAGGTLFVPDYSNNRVMVFDVAAITDGEDAVNVLGQIDGADGPFYTSSSTYNTPNAQGFSTPTHVAVDTVHHRIFVAEDLGRRVLVFNLDTDNVLVDHTADKVLGQATFKTSTGATTQSTVNRVRGLAYDATGDRLFVSDWGNNRVMVFDVAAITNGENAINVLGQTDFVTATAGTTQSTLSGPEGLAFDATGNRLFVADGANSRIMVFDVNTAVLIPDDSLTDGPNALNELGQTDFFTVAPAATDSTLDSPIAVAVYEAGNRLYVSDTANSRIMVFNIASIADGEPAVNVLGQADFVTGSGGAATASTMSSPNGIAFDPTGIRLFVSDSGNHRIMVFDVAAITDGEDATDVYGQADLVSGASAVTQSGLNTPYGIVFNDADDTLIVIDQSNNRAMIFDVAAAPAGTPTPTPTPNGGGNILPTETGFIPDRILVNSGDENVNSQNVQVTLFASFTPTFSGTVDVLLSNDPSFSTFIPYRFTIEDALAAGREWPKTVAWDLCFGIDPSLCAPGAKLVYARYYVNIPRLQPSF